LRDSVRAAFLEIAGRFSDDVTPVDPAVLQSRYSVVEAWPADAQLGLYTLAWALGPGFHMKGFREALNSTVVPDFARAASAIEVKENPSLITLGGIAKHAFRNAAVVVNGDLDYGILYWPISLQSCGPVY
jgi:hypothetical protein